VAFNAPFRKHSPLNRSLMHAHDDMILSEALNIYEAEIEGTIGRRQTFRPSSAEGCSPHSSCSAPQRHSRLASTINERQSAQTDAVHHATHFHNENRKRDGSCSQEPQKGWRGVNSQEQHHICRQLQLT
jgi:hypothetical protein